jgi:hypothetical protein
LPEHCGSHTIEEEVKENVVDTPISIGYYGIQDTTGTQNTTDIQRAKKS